MKSLSRILKSNFLICLVLFGVSLLSYVANLRYIGTTDTLINERFAQTFADTGHLYLEEPFDYGQIRKIEDLPQNAPSTTEVDGKWYSKYPPTTPVLASPFFKAFSIIGLDNTRLIGKFSAAILTALSIPVFYLLVLKLTTRRIALIISIIYALGSSTFGVTSQALWQHTMSQFAAIVMLWLVVYAIQLSDDKADKKTFFKKFSVSRKLIDAKLFFSIGLLLGLLIAIRTTGAFTALFIGLLILATRDIKKIAYTIIGGIIPLALLLAYNHFIFGSILASGYGDETKYGWVTPFYVGFFGLLLSPSAGLFAFSPVYLFSIHGFIRTIKEALSRFSLGLNRTNLLLACFGIWILNVLVYSFWWAWYGNSWVYRMIVDTLPFLTLLLIPALESNASKNILYKSVLVVATVFSVYMQFLGAFSFDYTWESQKLQSYKDTHVWFDVKNSHMAYLLSNQKYYVRNPQRTVYVVGDKFGDTISFNQDVEVHGDKRMIHAAFLNLGPSPEIQDQALVVDRYAEGVSFYVSPVYLGCALDINVAFDLSRTQESATFQIRELKDGGEVELTKLQVRESVSFKLENSAEEIRVQNDDTDDTFAIKKISLQCRP